MMLYAYVRGRDALSCASHSPKQPPMDAHRAMACRHDEEIVEVHSTFLNCIPYDFFFFSFHFFSENFVDDEMNY